jgi:hypothetical protein
MPTRSTFSFGGGKEVAEFMAARGQVIANIEEVYEKAERYGTELIHSTSYGYVGIDCQPLKLDEDGKHLNLPGLVFFRPRGAAWVAPVRVTDSEGEEDLKQVTEKWDKAQDNLLVSGLHSQVWYVFSALEWMFFGFRREFRRGVNQVAPNLRQKSEWVKRYGI